MQRRVYDALNVFSALEIVHKNKNKISLTSQGIAQLDDKKVVTPAPPSPKPQPSPLKTQKSTEELMKLKV